MSNEERILGELAGISQRLSGIEGRLTLLQWIGTLIFAGLLGSYAALILRIIR